MIIKLRYFFVGLVIKLYIKLYTSVNYLKFSNFFRNVFMLTRILLMSKFYSFLFFAILLFIYTFVVYIIFLLYYFVQQVLILIFSKTHADRSSEK